MKNILLLTVLLAATAVGAYLFTIINKENTSSTVTTQTSGDQLQVSTSFYPTEYILTELLGGQGSVVNVAKGVDPHDFRPSTQDILTFQKSDLVVLHGAELEPWGEDVASQLSVAGVPVLFASADLDLMEASDKGHGEHKEKNHDEHDGDTHHDGDEHDEHKEEDHHDEEDHDEHEDEHHEEDGHDEHDHGAFDPHTWLDPVLFAQTVDTVALKLSTIDPINKEVYASRAQELTQNILSLDAEYTQSLSNCSLEEVITSHDAFGYLAERYGFEIHAIAGLSTQDVPSTVTLAMLKEEASEGIGAILLEENSVIAYGETLARETGLETLSVNPIAYVIPEGEDYLTLMRSNLSAFTKALQCNG